MAGVLMPYGGDGAAFERVFATLTRARLTSAAMFAGALVILSVGVSSVSGAPVSGPAAVEPALAASDAPTPTPTPAPAPQLSAAERTTLEDVERYLEIAALPTATPVPPTATAVPPTPALPAPTRTPTTLRPTAPAPTATVAVPPPSLPGLDTSPMDAYSRALFDATNGRRAGAGLPPLRANGQLVGIARIRSRDMADHNYFAHVSPVTGDNAFTIMDRFGVPYGWAGENLAKNNYPDDEAVGVADDALWNSPPHRENILNPNYTDMGIALVIDGSGMKYFTIVFTGPP